MTRPLPRLAQLATLVALGVAAIYAQLIPLGPGGDLVAPDLLYCLVIAWAIRVPAALPFGLVVLLGLFGDLMLSRPLGLGALALLAASEAVRAHRDRLRGTPFVLEWLAAVAVFAASLAFMHMALRLTLAEPPGPEAAVRYMVATGFAYPMVALVLSIGLGLGGALGAAARRGGPS